MLSPVWVYFAYLLWGTAYLPVGVLLYFLFLRELQIFLESGIPILRNTVQYLKTADIEMDVMKQQCGTFDKSIRDKFKDDGIL